MTKKLPTIVFFGSGPVAAASLRFLAKHFPIEAVITKSRAPHHKVLAPVEQVIDEFGLAAYFANNTIDLQKLTDTHTFKSRLGIVVDYGLIMSESTINSFELGIINSHFSLLPEWRGADPITFTVLSGQKETGVSLMKIVQALDEGMLISQESLAVSPSITTPELTEQLIALSNKMLLRDIPNYVLGELKLYPQPSVPASYSRKLSKEDGIIDWSKSAEVIEREIRAYAGWPKSVGKIGNHTLIITQADVVSTSGTPGEYSVANKELMVYCGDQALRLKKVQPPGKKEMPIQAFLAGYKL